MVTALRLRDQRPPSQLARLLAGEPPETLALALALGAPPASILEWTRNLRHVRLEITGDDLVRAGVPESAAIGRALEGTLARKLDGEVSGREQELAAALEIAGVPVSTRRSRSSCPGAHVAFSTRPEGVSEGPYASLNLGILTDDERRPGAGQPRAPGGRPGHRGGGHGPAGARHRHGHLGRAVHGADRGGRARDRPARAWRCWC